MSDQAKFEITGPIHHIGQTQQITEKFRKRDLVLLLDGNSKWPQTVPFTFTGDRCDMLDSYGEGEIVKVTFNLRGRKYNDRYFGELSAFKIEAVGQAARPAPTQGAAYGAPPDDDLPF